MMLEDFKVSCNEFTHVIDSIDSDYRNLLCDHETIKANLTPLLKEDERFRYIKGFPNYVITDYGRVFNIITLKELKPGVGHNSFSQRNKETNNYRWLHVVLCNNGKQYHKRVHRLVAYAFLDAPDSSIVDPVVDHIDHNTFNNHYTNLRWISRVENCANSVKNKYTNMSIEELIELRKTCVYKSKQYNVISRTICTRRKKLK